MTVRYIKKIPQVVEFLDFLPSRVSVHFIPYRKDKMRTVQKKMWMVVNPTWKT
jgi:hypothetical protein